MKKFFLSCLFFLLGISGVQMLHAGNEVYTCFNQDTGILTYYYDDQRASRFGKVELYDPISRPEGPRFVTYSDKVTKIVLDPSMKNVKLTNMQCMFFGGQQEYNASIFYPLKSVTAIEGMEYLNTEEAINMMEMFSALESLQSIDLSHFNTDKVKYMAYMFDYCMSLESIDVNSFNINNVQLSTGMFKGCKALKTIYCENDWTKLVDGRDMFLDCTSLVGDQGSSYSTYKVTNSSFAHLDGGSSNPGYFSKKNEEAIKNVGQEPKANSQKLIRDGQLLIERNGKIYNATGVEVK